MKRYKSTTFGCAASKAVLIQSFPSGRIVVSAERQEPHGDHGPNRFGGQNDQQHRSVRQAV